MQTLRTLSILFGLAAIALAAVVAVKSAPHLPTSPGDAGAAAVDAAPDALASTTTTSAATDTAADAGVVLLADLTAGDDLARPAGSALPNGTPRQVRFGVVLVQYDGAQGTTGKVRSKADAMAMAQKLAEEAKSDFHGAVQHGDPGSSVDLGRMQRGVLEPSTEMVLFTLPAGGVSDVIDTPRGFWIAKRIE